MYILVKVHDDAYMALTNYILYIRYNYCNNVYIYMKLLIV